MHLTLPVCDYIFINAGVEMHKPLISPTEYSTYYANDTFYQNITERDASS